MDHIEEIRLCCVCSPSDPLIIAARQLFREYAGEIRVDLSFQNFAEELANMPGKYSRPPGRLFVVSFKDEPAGCVAIRPLRTGTCEMKRLYVRAQYRGYGIARHLAHMAINAAREIGYEAIYLDTLPQMTAAIAL
jgi:ribosomal protein S18 acetylase RimI-like enzyme